MNRKGGLYDRFLTKKNFEKAHENASRHKSGKSGVIKFNEDVDGNIGKLLKMHSSGSFTSTPCVNMGIKDRRKFRVLSIRPYAPDKVTQHGVINVIAPILRASFTRDTYTNLKGHGLHQCVVRLQRDLYNDYEGTKFCLQIDLKHHYPSMEHDVMKDSVRHKIKDKRIVSLIDDFIDTMPGLSLGDPVSGWIENAVMSPFDHKVKEVYGIRYYYRFQDDMVFLAADSGTLHRLLESVRADMSAIGQSIKDNWQIFPVDGRGIDFIGYRFFHGYTLLRKSIKRDIFRLIRKYAAGKVDDNAFEQSMASRMGWLTWCDSFRLRQKIYKEIEEAQIKRKELSNESAK